MYGNAVNITITECLLSCFICPFENMYWTLRSFLQYTIVINGLFIVYPIFRWFEMISIETLNVSELPNVIRSQWKKKSLTKLYYQY